MLRIEPMSFVEFHSLLSRMTKDYRLYEQHQDKIYIVPAKLLQHLYFNIEKKPKSSRKKRHAAVDDDKYHYVVRALFTGTTNETGFRLTVQVKDKDIRPHFALKPSEMRALSRTDRNESARLVREGGDALRKDIVKLASWKLTLSMKADVYFGGAGTNGNGQQIALDNHEQAIVYAERE